MKARDALRQEQRVGLDRVLVDVRESIARIRAAPPQMAEEARYAARQLAGDAERYADALKDLPAHLVETWNAAASLMFALESVEAELMAPTPGLVEAQRAMGAVAAHVGAAGRAAKQRAVAAQHGTRGGRPSKADRDAALVARFEERQRGNRTLLTARELYEDVAAEHDVDWTVVRDAVLRKTPAG